MALIGRARLTPLVAAFITVFLFYSLFQYCLHNFIGVAQSPLQLHSDQLRTSYDFIVVGGGQSGLTVANRLSEDGKSTVLVIEYGYLYRDDPLISRPWRPFNPSRNIFHDPKLMFNLSSTPQSGLNGRKTPVEAGATVGGGSTVNGMFLNRGAAEDYNAWEQLGNLGWGWEGLLPYFKKSVTFTPPGDWLQQEYGTTYDVDSAYGGEGPIHSSYPPWAWPGQRVQLEAWKEMGVKQSREGAGGNAVGLFWVPRAQNPVTQTRSYAVTGHLDPAFQRENFKLLTGHRVVKVVLSDDLQADGVVIKPRDVVSGNKTFVRARKEVIIAAGLHSPIVLQRSGIGPQKVLEAAGIDVRLNLPGVGMNLQDHPHAGIPFLYRSDLPLNPGIIGSNTPAAHLAEAEFRSSRSGPHVGGHNLVAFLTGADFLPSPTSIQNSISDQVAIRYLPAAYSSRTLLDGYMAQRKILIAAMGAPNSTLIETPLAGDAYALLILQKPLSRGTITVDPTDPYDGEALVDFGTFRNPIDVEILRHMVRFSRRLYNTTAMRALSPVEQAPGEKVMSDDALEQYLRETAGSSIGHESGTCAMMPRELGGVVDANLQVYGVGRLSVVDASVIPLVPSTNLCATVYAVAEKAADLIKSRH